MSLRCKIMARDADGVTPLRDDVRVGSRGSGSGFTTSTQAPSTSPRTNGRSTRSRSATSTPATWSSKPTPSGLEGAMSHTADSRSTISRTSVTPPALTEITPRRRPAR